MESKPFLILGATGQVGNALSDLLLDKAILLSKSQFDVSMISQLEDKLTPYRSKIRAIINAAAFTNTDLAEENKNYVKLVNAIGPYTIAYWCFRNNVPLIHYSTDYVFSGMGNNEWKEDDPIEPINYYGSSKAHGDQLISSIKGRWLIFRTSWVFSLYGKNLLTKIIDEARVKNEITAISDSSSNPTYANDLAEATIEGFEYAERLDIFPSGIYHITNKGSTTRFEFAKRVIALSKELHIDLKCNKIIPVKTQDTYKVPRPLNSRLNTEKIRKVLRIEMPHWETSLHECMKRLVSTQI